MKQLMKDTMDLTKTGIVTGIGASAIKEAGGDPAIMTGVSKHLPLLGNVAGTRVIVGALKRLR